MRDEGAGGRASVWARGGAVPAARETGLAGGVSARHAGDRFLEELHAGEAGEVRFDSVLGLCKLLHRASQRLLILKLLPQFSITISNF